MKLILALFLILLVGCEQSVNVPDYTGRVACGLALTSMMDVSVPVPDGDAYKCNRCKDTGWITHGDGHKTKCPDCGGGSPPQGWIISDAKELIAKGNKLADRGKALLDQAEQDGKITVDIYLPKPPQQTQAKPQTVPQRDVCPVEVEPQRVYYRRRWRRWRR